MAKIKETKIKEYKVKSVHWSVKGSKYCPLRKDNVCLSAVVICLPDANAFPDGCPLPVKVCRVS